MKEEYFNHLLEKIDGIRKRNNLTQDDVARILDISRATYINMGKKNSRRDFTLRELNSFAHYFNMSLNDLLGETGNRKKFKQMYFYALKFFKKGVPKTKLAKILYLSDFKHYYSYGKAISNENYIHRRYGPVAEDFLDLTDELYDDGKIKIMELDRGAFLIVSLVFRPKEDLLSDGEKNTIEKVCRAWKKQSTAEIVNYTHEQKPWAETEDGDRIPYDLILKEDPNHIFQPVAG